MATSPYLTMLEREKLMFGLGSGPLRPLTQNSCSYPRASGIRALASRRRSPDWCLAFHQPSATRGADVRAVPRDPGTCPLGQITGCSCEGTSRSEEHTSELQSRENLVCRLLLEKKK